MGWLYFCIIIFANTLGAISGMGGGVIIKPLLDTIGIHPVYAISFYSSVAVLTMSLASTIKQIKNGIALQWNFALLISVGSILGGILGDNTFEKILDVYPSGKEVLLVQISLTVLSLIFSWVYSIYPFKKFCFTSTCLKIGAGLILGFLASLLGIGGGPINVAVLMCFFNLSIKESTVYSIVTIFFSQLSKVSTIAISTGFSRYDLSLLMYIIPAAILGGFIGAMLSGRLGSKYVTRVYQIVIIAVLIINLFNAWQII